MSCQISRLWQLVGPVWGKGWLAVWMEGEPTGWLTCWLKKCGPYHTNRVNKALWEGESLTCVDIRPRQGLEGWFYFLVCCRVDLWVTDRRSTSTWPVLCLATLLTAPEGPHHLWERADVGHGFSGVFRISGFFWTLNSDSFVVEDYCFSCSSSHFLRVHVANKKTCHPVFHTQLLFQLHFVLRFMWLTMRSKQTCNIRGSATLLVIKAVWSAYFTALWSLVHENKRFCLVLAQFN